MTNMDWNCRQQDVIMDPVRNLWSEKSISAAKRYSITESTGLIALMKRTFALFVLVIWIISWFWYQKHWHMWLTAWHCWINQPTEPEFSSKEWPIQEHTFYLWWSLLFINFIRIWVPLWHIYWGFHFQCHITGINTSVLWGLACN